MPEQSNTPYGTAAPTWNPGYPPPAARTSPRAVVVLVLGVASLTVFWGLAGIAALVIAPGAKREIARSGGTVEGAGLVRAGVICSWISIALTILFAAAIIGLLFAAGGGSGGVDTSITTVPNFVP